jgi:hypothetical protein
MSDLFWLTEAQMARPKPFFPLSHGVPRVDDRRVLSGIIFINRNGLRRRDAPAAYGPPKTLCNRWARWSRLRASSYVLQPQDWRSGPNIKIVVCVSPFALRSAIKKQFWESSPQQ